MNPLNIDLRYLGIRGTLFLLKTKIQFFVNAAFNIYEEKYLEESFCGTFLLKSVQWFCRESLPEKQISNL